MYGKLNVDVFKVKSRKGRLLDNIGPVWLIIVLQCFDAVG